MIVFDGLITGETYKRYQHKLRMFNLKAIAIPSVLCGAILFLLMFKVFHPGIAAAVGCLITLLWLAIFLLYPYTKKERLAITPKRIIIDDDIMTCETATNEEDRHIDDVDIVYDAGAYYEIVFRFGRVSTRFLCQKDLLSKGSLKEFESLFEDKLIVKDKKYEERA